MTDVRETIRSCACALYLEDGFEGFSMRKLARAVGVTAPAIYRHYESKEALLLDVVSEATRQLVQYLYRALAGSTPEERFRIAGAAYLDFALEHPRYFQIVAAFCDLMGLDEVPEEVARQTAMVQQFWHDRVRECVQTGILREGDPEEIGLTLWAQAYGLISLYMKRNLGMPEEAFREAFSRSFVRVLRGLATPEYAAQLASVSEEAAEQAARSPG
jgi:AcrR family transcriptional regulator